MPSRPNTPCKHPGCPELVPAGTKYCDKHKAMHSEEVRPAAGRGYGSAWRKASKQFLERHPLCVKCREEGKFVKATVVDHIQAHRGDPELFWDRGNWQPLCKKHHDQKTGSEDSRPSYSYKNRSIRTR